MYNFIATQQLRNMLLIFILFFFCPISVLGAGYDYDKLNRMAQVAYDAGQTVTYKYDVAGNIEEIIPTFSPDTTQPSILLEVTTPNAQHLVNTSIAFKTTPQNYPANVQISKYEWDWETDGKIDVSGINPINQYTYNKAGNYTVTVKVTDSTGQVLSNTAALTINDTVTPPPQTDTDSDGILDEKDNCKTIANTNQADMDDDKIGDVCDNDRDGDGWPNDQDPAPDDKNNPGSQTVDLTNWKQVYAGGILNDLVYANSKLVAVGDKGKILTSSDGETWNSASFANQANMDIKAVAYGNGKWVAVGRVVNPAYKDSGVILVSSDTNSWDLVSSGYEYPFTDVAFGDGKWVAAGESKFVQSSTDGRNWTKGYFNKIWGIYDFSFLKVTYDSTHKIWVAIGDNSKHGGNLIATSLDGYKWDESQINADVSRISYRLFDIEAGNGTVVAVGTSIIMISTDGGVTWADQSRPDSSLYGTDYLADFGWLVFYASGKNFLLSPDALTWVSKQHNVSAGLDHAVQVGGKIFAL